MIGKFGYIKIKDICASKDATRKVKIQDIKWLQVFTIHIIPSVSQAIKKKLPLLNKKRQTKRCKQEFYQKGKSNGQ